MKREWSQGEARSSRAGDGNAGMLSTRRELIRRASILAMSVASVGFLEQVLVACSGTMDPTLHVMLDVSTEIGALNYVDALLQLESDFYTRVSSNKYPGMTVAERDTFTQFQNTVVVARDDMQANQIPAGRITDTMLFRFGSVVDFSDRNSVLTNARTIEETAANALQALSGLVTSSDKQSLVADLTAQAQDRASTVDTWLGVTFTPGTVNLATAMTTLAPYYLTAITVSNA